MLTFIVESCEGCGATGKRQSQPQQVKNLRMPDGPPKPVAVCMDCAKEIDKRNAPYELMEREADEKAKAIMDEKLAAAAKEEEAKKAEGGKVIEMIAAQNQMMLGMMQQTQALMQALVEQNAKPARTRKPRTAG